ncbi:MAG: glutathione S-transferase family protein [Pseudomonadota bacterium]
MSYTLIGHVRSRAIRVMWMLEELGVDWTFVQAAPRSDEAHRYNSSGKVPILLDGEVRLTDSVAIMTWLGDRHDALTFPAGSHARAQQDALTLWLIDEFDAVLWTAAKHSFVLPEAQRVPAIRDSVAWEIARTANAIGELLDDRPYLMGDDMTITDILATHCGTWARAVKFAFENDTFDAYLARMSNRPALARARAKTG